MKLESVLKKEIVNPLFAGLPSRAPDDVPVAIVRNREKRAKQRVLDALAARGVAEVPPELSARLRGVVASWGARGFVDSFTAAEELEIECAREGERRAAEGDSSRMHALVEAEYRAWVLRRYAKIELRGLQLSHRVMQALEDTYVPLHVTDPAAIARNEIEALIGGHARVPVDEFLAREKRALLVGAPGSGKSTLVAWLATLHARGTETVPFVLLARSSGDATVGIAEIARQAELPVDFVETCIRSGRALVLVDGIDEAKDGPAFQRSVAELSVTFPDCAVVATSRPAGCEEIPGFKSATLAPMTREEVGTFVDRWCLSAELSVQSDTRSATEAAKRAAESLKGRIRSSRPVERLAENPLMCGVVCIVHRFLGERIPERRAALYEACTNVLLYEWDRAKFAPGAAIGVLEADQKRFLLGELALRMHERGVAEIGEAEVLRAIEERLPGVKVATERAAEIVADIRDRSGLLVERSPGVFGFSHLSFQEYLAATELVRERQTARLVSHAVDEWWGEVIVLAAGVPGAEAGALIRGLLAVDTTAEEGAVGRALILAALCMESAVSVPATLRAEVEGRIAPLVPPTSLTAAHRLAELGEVIAPLLLSTLDGKGTDNYALIALYHVRPEAAVPRFVDLLHGPEGFLATALLCVYAAHFDLARVTLLREMAGSAAVVGAVADAAMGGLTSAAKILALHEAATKPPQPRSPKRAARTG